MGFNTPIKDRIIKTLVRRRNKVLNGGVNCIPLPFERFREVFPGIEQRKYYVITGGTKSSKTQLMTFIFIINTVLFIYNNPGIIRAKIFYFPLEETKEDITLRFMAFLLNNLTEGKYHISPTDLQSTDERKPVPEEALKIMESEEFNKIYSIFESIVEFRDEQNPTGMYKVMSDYAESHGKTFYNDIEFDTIDEMGIKKHVKTKEFDHYEPYDPDEYVMGIADHVGCLHLEKDVPTLKQTIERWSDYCIRLRNRYGYILCNVQQQNMETTNLEAFKANKIRPTKDGLKDSKKTGEDCNVLIGITNPFAFELSDYHKYNIMILRDCARFMEIVLNRGGRANELCPLFFDGAVDNYKELPLPEQVKELQQVYNYVTRSGRFFFMKSKGKLKLGLHRNKILRIFAVQFKRFRKWQTSSLS